MNQNLFEVFSATAEKNAQNTAFKQILGGELTLTTYHALMQKVMNYRSHLESYALTPGSRIGLLATSSPDWVIAYFACLSLKLTVVCLDPGMSIAQISHEIKTTNTNILMIDNNSFDPKLADAYGSATILGIKHELICLYTDPTLTITPDDTLDPEIASILFTSGTTGAFKAVLLEHRALLQSTNLCKEIISVTSNDSVLCLLPAHHVYTLVCVILTAMLAGSSITFIGKLEPKAMSQAFIKGKPTVLIGVPRVYEMQVKRIKELAHAKGKIFAPLFFALISSCAFLRKWTRLNLGKCLFSHIHQTMGGKMKFLISGGAPLDHDVYNTLYGLGFLVLEGYGLTETCGLLTVNPVIKQKVGSVGKAIKGISINIHKPDESGVGEIWARGPTLMQAYLHDNESTAVALKDGWYHTGDLGFFDTEGYLYITGRIKELIVLPNGKKVAPTLIESCLKEIPNIESFAVVGIADNGKEKIHIAMVLIRKEPQASLIQNLHEIIKIDVKNRINKLPKWYHSYQIDFVENIPQTSSLKVKRHELANLLKAKMP
jgi:long-chain acyl-CoA synthetase